MTTDTARTTDTASGAGNLPAEPNSFVGRERDLAERAGLLGKVRALTLCGPGGVGKTRLALRLAAGLAAGYPDGTWLVDLADAGEPGRLVPLVAHVLGIRAERDRLLADTLTAALRSRSMLLIFDTCGHLIDACAALARQLLADCPAAESGKPGWRCGSPRAWRPATRTAPGWWTWPTPASRVGSSRWWPMCWESAPSGTGCWLTRSPRPFGPGRCCSFSTPATT